MLSSQLIACVESRVGVGENFRFVQIGAAFNTLHAAMQSSRPRHRYWDGVFVEPDPGLMMQLKTRNKNFEGAYNVGFVNAFINRTCPPDRLVPLFVPSTSNGEISGQAPGIQVKRFKRIHVLCETPSELADHVNAHAAHNPHVLVIEGNAKILLDLVYAGWPFGRPAVITFKYRSGQDRDVIKTAAANCQVRFGGDYVALACDR